MQCPRGTFYNTTLKICQPCPFGSYNDQLGQIICKFCPVNHTTRKLQSKSRNDCKELCPPGTVAKEQYRYEDLSRYTSFRPYCRKCKPGEYNNDYNQVTCRKCPPGYTSSRGAKSCYIPKQECVLNKNEYQVDECGTGPCYNVSICEELYLGTLDRSKNTCEDQNHGQPCEDYIYSEDVDPCIQNTKCENGGTCIQINGTVTCECPYEFEGENCKQLINFCAEQPCSNGHCISLSTGYQCICLPGFIGKRCHLKPCDYMPCAYIPSAICIDVVTTNITTRDNFK